MTSVLDIGGVPRPLVGRNRWQAASIQRSHWPGLFCLLGAVPDHQRRCASKDVTASDVAYWHGADIKPRPPFGWVESGHHLLGLSLSGFDPKRSWPMLAPFA
jgi:hypothetical protein